MKNQQAQRDFIAAAIIIIIIIIIIIRTCVDERMILKRILQKYKHMDWINLAHDRIQQSISL
jgi:hypothetical protein